MLGAIIMYGRFRSHRRSGRPHSLYVLDRSRHGPPHDFLEYSAVATAERIRIGPLQGISRRFHGRPTVTDFMRPMPQEARSTIGNQAQSPAGSLAACLAYPGNQEASRSMAAAGSGRYSMMSGAWSIFRKTARSNCSRPSRSEAKGTYLRRRRHLGTLYHLHPCRPIARSARQCATLRRKLSVLEYWGALMGSNCRDSPFAAVISGLERN